MGWSTILISDIGSLPPRTSTDTLWSGSRKAQSIIPLLGVRDDDYFVFRSEVVKAFTDKLLAGIEVPNYPQFRDMNTMFFTLMEGFEKTSGGLMAVKNLEAKPEASIPEVDVIRKDSAEIRDASGSDRVRVKICVTGPYTLASFFKLRTPNLFEALGNATGDILSRSMFSNKSAEVAHVCLDEPVLGFLNDPLLDYGAEGRESLMRAWEYVCRVASSRGVDTSMHLHDTSENLFWDVKHLGSVMTHVGDPLYTQESAKQRLEETDKMLWATVGVTQFDNLISAYLAGQGFNGNMPEKIGETWTGIRVGSIDPYIFLEEPARMRKRLEGIAGFFGVERIAYASPECGLSSFPSYDVALECLRMTSEAIDGFRRSLCG